MMISRVIGLLVPLLLYASGVASQCLEYEPSVVSLTGSLSRDTFPGPPNYESVKDGDTPEVYWILHVDRPVCVTGAHGDDVNVSERAVTRIQLILTGQQYAEYRSLVAKRVRATGTLSHQLTGHHHETLLLTVSHLVAAGRGEH